MPPAAALACVPEPRLPRRARASLALPPVKRDLRDQCTATLSWSQSCPPHTSHISDPTSSSVLPSLFSFCLETVQPGGSRDASRTAAKSILSRTQKGCLPGHGPSCPGAPEPKGDRNAFCSSWKESTSSQHPTSTCIIRGHKGGQYSYLCEIPYPHPDGLLRLRPFSLFTF